MSLSAESAPWAESLSRGLNLAALFDLQGILILLAVAFVPSIVFAAIIAGAKRYRKEPGYTLRRAFIWGALGAAFISLFVNTLVSGTFARPYLHTETSRLLFTALIVAPIVEEAAKAFGMRFVRDETDEVVDGLIYGAVIGLGFAATENLFYEASALIESGRGAWVWTAVARTFSSTLLHATASAITGYGIARAMTRRGSWFGVFPRYVAAVLLHSLFNFMATFGALFGTLGLVPLIAFAVWGFGKVKTRVTEMSLVAPDHHWRPLGRSRRIQQQVRSDKAEADRWSGKGLEWERMDREDRHDRDDEPERWFPIGRR